MPPLASRSREGGSSLPADGVFQLMRLWTLAVLSFQLKLASIGTEDATDLIADLVSALIQVLLDFELHLLTWQLGDQFFVVAAIWFQATRFQELVKVVP